MVPFYLKFANEAAAFAAMPLLTATDEDGTTIWAQSAHTAVMPLPALALPTGDTYTDEYGVEHPVMSVSPDYHLNVLTDDPEVMAAIEALPALCRPEPETPVVVWAVV
ncbi:hypothetical protein [Paenirhodobacter sp. CAU 1674]|uniref:hypothetical protein n=1 Tax=Paenirhodobacter sp. CAU 1674 TaxID=3032596 RepID=UPI0023DC1D12|nr:hypothetical protein [Paenirhodobacter sp. CAU 1674]MDF2143191.1 hypothetical protein [Paenirhodobacter sp. CAU 1674]